MHSDDINHLVDRANWNGARYKTFRKGSQSTTPIDANPAAPNGSALDNTSATAAAVLDAPMAVTTDSPAPIATIRPAAAQPVFMAAAPRPQPQLSPAGRWNALRAIMSDSRTADPVTSGAPSVPSVKIMGAGGGRGVSTVVATLARALSHRHESVAVIDNDPETTLPYYLGGSNRRAPGAAFSMMRPSPASIFLLAPSASAAPAEQEMNWLWEGYSQLQPALHRVLLNAWPEVPAQFSDAAPQNVTIVLVTPDLNSLSRIDSVLRSQAGANAYFLLNKFNEASALHRQVRTWMSEKLGGRLLPFEIRLADEIEEALAEGMTVLDSAPNSPAAADFRRLADWIIESGASTVPSMEQPQ